MDELAAVEGIGIRAQFLIQYLKLLLEKLHTIFWKFLWQNNSPLVLKQILLLLLLLYLLWTCLFYLRILLWTYNDIEAKQNLIINDLFLDPIDSNLDFSCYIIL